MESEIRVFYDRGNIVKGAKTYIFKKHIQDIVLSPIAFFLVVFWGYTTSANSTVFGIAITITLFYFCGVVYMYFLKPHQSATCWEKLGLEEATFKFTERGVKSVSSIGESEFEWGGIKRYWFTPDFLILVYKSGMHSSIPANDFSEELKSFIVSKLKVRNK